MSLNTRADVASAPASLATPKQGRISRNLRFAILSRDNHCCRYCGAAAPDVKLTVDHVVPVVLGGSNDPTNLVAACAPCNGGKAAIPPDAALVADVEADALRWAAARVKAAEMFRAIDTERDEKVQEVIDHWNDFVESQGKRPSSARKPGDNPAASIAHWIDRGLEPEDIGHMIEYVLANRARSLPPTAWWAYLAGCCWNRIREIDAEAQAIIDADLMGGAA